MTKPVLSFEFFPPRTDAQSRRFWQTLGCLETLEPDWFSVTYGALGSASQASTDTVAQLCKQSTKPIAAHLTCSGQTRSQLLTTLEKFKNMGVERIVALRGDSIPAGPDSKYYKFRFASELVELIKESGDFDISVAAYPEVHPEAVSAQNDMDILKLKFDTGASRALTQFFFEPDVFLRWRDKAVKHGIDGSLIPGILPIHDMDKVISFSQRCGASVPIALIERFKSTNSEPAARQMAIEHSVDLCQTLRHEGVEKFHFYTLNQSDLSYEVAKSLLEVEASTAVA